MSQRFGDRRVRGAWVSPALPQFIGVSTPSTSITDTNVNLPTGYDHSTDLMLGFSGYASSLDASITNDFNWTNPAVQPIVSSYNKFAGGGVWPSMFGTYLGPGPYNSLAIRAGIDVALFTLSGSGFTQMRANVSSGFSNGPAYVKRVGHMRNVYRGTDPARRVWGAWSSNETANDPTTVVLPGVTAPSANSLLLAVVLHANGLRFQAADNSFSHHAFFNIWIGSKLVPAGPTGNVTLIPEDFSGNYYACGKARGFLICLDSNTAP